MLSEDKEIGFERTAAGDVKANVAKSVKLIRETFFVLGIAVCLLSCRSNPDTGQVFRFKVGDMLMFIPPEGSMQMERIRQDGTIEVPAVGVVVAAGKSFDELYQEIATKNPRYKRSDVRTAGSPYYFVDGEVRKPGPKVLARRITVSEAIREAGGLTARARRAKVTLTHGDGKKERIKLGDKTYDPQIYPGDTITVHRPGIF